MKTGCEKARELGYHGDCFDCPFEHCLEDEIHAVANKRKEDKYKKIREKHLEGKKQEEIAKELGVCIRTVYRAIHGK